MSKSIDQELLPCPFCGDPNPNLTHDDYIHEDGQPMAVVECTKCHTWVQAEAWNSRASVQPAGVAVPEGWRDAIHNTLRNYRMSTLDDGEGCGYPLIDAMSADGQTVAGGIEECGYLADAIVDGLAAAPHPVSGEQVDGDSHAPVVQDVGGLAGILERLVHQQRAFDRDSGLLREAEQALAAHRAQQGEQPS